MYIVSGGVSMNFELYEAMREVLEVEFTPIRMNEMIDVVISVEKSFELKAKESAFDQIALSQAFSL